jgi:hypothetical protein
MSKVEGSTTGFIVIPVVGSAPIKGVLSGDSKFIPQDNPSNLINEDSKTLSQKGHLITFS